MSIEIWKPIPGYEGDYEVSNLGRVKRLRGCKGFYANHISRGYTNRKGYWYASLTKNSHRKSCFIHRLVMMAFCGESDLQVNHIDGNKSNNCLDNLEYVTGQENITHAINVLGHHFAPPFMNRRGQDSYVTHLTNDDIYEIRRLYSSGSTQSEIAKRFGITRPNVSIIVNYKSWSHLK